MSPTIFDIASPFPAELLTPPSVAAWLALAAILRLDDSSRNPPALRS
jgi:hypothetical protein